MKIFENVSLANFSTMRLGGPARFLAEARHKDDVEELVAWAKDRSLPIITIGYGSNIVWRDEGWPGLVIVNLITGGDIISEDEQSVTVRVSGGDTWDEVVEAAAKNGWSGVEFLSLIPGTAGAAPVQNIGAYGAELSSVLVEVEAYDTFNNAWVTLQSNECGFGYRTSRFKTSDKRRFIICGLSLQLSKTVPAPPFYEALERYFEQHPVPAYTPLAIRQAVIAIRSAKLPDPKKVANNGSFFTNPIINQEHYAALFQKYPDIKGWPTPDGRVKLAAGWLVEKAGFRGVHDEDTGMATWENQALVLVNEGARSTNDLLAFRQKIIFAVDQLFGVVLEQEPELLP
jgi:UDP-N-acetylmuramate dehydrogenase